MTLNELLMLTESKSKLRSFKKRDALKTAKKFLTIKKHDAKMWDKLQIGKDNTLKSDLVSAFMSSNSKAAIDKIIKSTNKEEFLIAINALARAHGGKEKFLMKIKHKKQFVKAITPFLDDTIINASSSEEIESALEKFTK